MTAPTPRAAQGAVSAPQQRQTVLIADLVESVRLMRQAESALIARWRHFVHQVREALLPAHGGRLVKSLGDGLLIVFERPAQAVAAAHALHRCMASDPAPVPMALRVSVHVADLVVDELDVYGSGVNLAARLLGAARPGGTVGTAEVRDELADGLDAHVVDLGDCYFKHWDDPVRVYQLDPVGMTRPAPAWPAAGGEPADERASVAVFPFAGAPGTETWGLALAEALNAALSGTAALRVVSLLSTRAMRDPQPDPAQVRRMLGAAYLVTGRVAATGRRLHAEIELCGTRHGHRLWAGRVDVDAGDLFTARDASLLDAAARLGHAIAQTELQRARALPMANLESYTLYTAGVQLLHRLSRADFALALELLEHLAERHPRSAAPQALLSKWHLLCAVQGWAPDRRVAAERARAAARRATDLDPEHALALSMQAILVAQLDGDLDAARALGEAAVAADPQESHAWLNLGGIHSYAGDAEAAVAMPQRAIELSPLDPARFVFDAFRAEGLLTAGRHDDAAAAARDSIRLNAMHGTSHRLLMLALALAGKVDEARAAAASLLQLEPGFTIDAYRRGYAGRDRPHAAARVAALREIGLPEH